MSDKAPFTYEEFKGFTEADRHQTQMIGPMYSKELMAALEEQSFCSIGIKWDGDGGIVYVFTDHDVYRRECNGWGMEQPLRRMSYAEAFREVSLYCVRRDYEVKYNGGRGIEDYTISAMGKPGIKHVPPVVLSLWDKMKRWVKNGN